MGDVTRRTFRGPAVPVFLFFVVCVLVVMLLNF